MDWIEGGSLIANPPWETTPNHAYGAGSHATAGKGRLWLDAAIEEKPITWNNHEQHERREQRINEAWIMGQG
jgi:hypothetical protein